MIVYQALYNPMIEESGYVTLSIHLSREGAEKVIAEHKEEAYKKWRRRYPEGEYEPFSFGKFEDWYVAEIEVLP